MSFSVRTCICASVCTSSFIFRFGKSSVLSLNFRWTVLCIKLHCPFSLLFLFKFNTLIIFLWINPLDQTPNLIMFTTFLSSGGQFPFLVSNCLPYLQVMKSSCFPFKPFINLRIVNMWHCRIASPVPFKPFYFNEVILVNPFPFINSCK